MESNNAFSESEHQPTRRQESKVKAKLDVAIINHEMLVHEWFVA